MSIDRTGSEDDWYDVGDASAIKSARRQAATPPTQSSMRFDSPPPPLAADANTAARFEAIKEAIENQSPFEDEILGEPTSLMPLEEEADDNVEVAPPTETEHMTDEEPEAVEATEKALADQETTSARLSDVKVSSVIPSPSVSGEPPTELLAHPEPTQHESQPITQQTTQQPTGVPNMEPPQEPTGSNEQAPTLTDKDVDATVTAADQGTIKSLPPPSTAPMRLATTVDSYKAYIPPKVVAVLLGIWMGFKDSSNMLQFVKYCDKDHSILRTFIHCTVLNTIFILSLFTIVDLVAPLQPTGAFAVVWDTLFSLLWVVPMYAITQILGITWYEEIYRKCVQVRASERNRPTQPTRDVSFIGVSELVMKFLVTLTFGILAALVAMVLPRNFLAVCGINIPVGFLISFAMSCWLHAFYCFDYRFLDQGRVDRGQPSDANVPSSQVAKLIPAKLSFLITIFERKWPYYLGYGASHILVRTMMEWMELPMFARMAVCSALFTVNVVTTVEASVRWKGDSTVGRLPIFTPFYKKLSVWVAAANTKRASAAKRGKEVAPTTKQPISKK